MMDLVPTLLLTLWVGCVGYLLLTASTHMPERDHVLQLQMQQIDRAQTVDDLKPILTEIVRKQRPDYR